MARVYERMHKFQIGTLEDRFVYLVRIWEKMENHDSKRKVPTQQYIRDWIDQAFCVPHNIPTTIQVASFVADMEGVAAVEVVDPMGNGYVIYPEWP